jgi:hypothetical protein
MTLCGTWFGDLTTQGHRQSPPARPTDEQPLCESERDVQACMFGESLFPRSHLTLITTGALNQRRATSLRACNRFATHGIDSRSSRLRARKGSATGTVEHSERFEANVWTTRPGGANEVVRWTATSLHLSACAAESG